MNLQPSPAAPTVTTITEKYFPKHYCSNEKHEKARVCSLSNSRLVFSKFGRHQEVPGTKNKATNFGLLTTLGGLSPTPPLKNQFISGLFLGASYFQPRRPKICTNSVPGIRERKMFEGSVFCANDKTNS